MNAPCPLELPLGLPLWRDPWALAEREPPEWLAEYRKAEAEAELAAEAVSAACERYKAARDDASAAAYRVADLAYDAARLRFQVASCEITQGVRAIAGIARHMQLADDGNRRML